MTSHRLISNTLILPFCRRFLFTTTALPGLNLPPAERKRGLHSSDVLLIGRLPRPRVTSSSRFTTTTAKWVSRCFPVSSRDILYTSLIGLLYARKPFAYRSCKKERTVFETDRNTSTGRESSSIHPTHSDRDPVEGTGLWDTDGRRAGVRTNSGLGQ